MRWATEVLSSCGAAEVLAGERIGPGGLGVAEFVTGEPRLGMDALRAADRAIVLA